MQNLRDKLFEPIHAAPLGFFRIIFGFLAASEVINNIFYRPRQEIYKSEYQFKYYGFEWVEPLPGYLTEAAFALIALFAIFVMIGFRYRTFSALFAVTYPYTYFLEKSDYLNHDYLFMMLALVMAFLPAEHVLSIDSRQKPEKYSEKIPRLPVLLLCFLMAVVYFYGGLAKLHADWLEARPLKIWLRYKQDHWLFGTLLHEPWVAYFMAWSGAALDLFAPFMLSFRRTRLLVLPAIIFFHITNTLIFLIGIFPWLSLSLSLLYFPNAVFEKWYAKIPFAGKNAERKPSFKPVSPNSRKLMLIGVGLLAAYQLLMPFRQYLYPSNPLWSEEGHRFSWRMMLRDKTGYMYYIIKNPKTGEEKRLYPRELLKPKQYRKMKTHPDMIVEYAHFLAEKIEKEEGYKPEIYAKTRIGLNGRPTTELVNDKLDLTKIEIGIWPPADWIMPHPDEQFKKEE